MSTAIQRFLIGGLYLVKVEIGRLIFYIKTGDRIRVAFEGGKSCFLLVLILWKFELLRERPEYEEYYSEDDVA